MGRRISKAGLELIQRFEGLRLAAYRDAVGVWTIGWGHTRTVRPGMKITRAEAEALLKEDVARFELCVESAVGRMINQNQYDALVSFAFNVGCSAMRRSTLVRKLRAGDELGAANEFGRWDKAGGRVLAGLTRRRAAERELFERNVTSESIGESGQAADPDGPDIDLPTLAHPFRDSAATRLLAHALGVDARRIETTDLLMAVERYQGDRGLVRDGVVGPVTWRALVESLARPATEGPLDAPADADEAA